MHAHALFDAHRVAAADKILAARFHASQATLHAAPAFFAGQDFIGGSHTMRIEQGVGVHVYRRAQSRITARGREIGRAHV